MVNTENSGRGGRALPKRFGMIDARIVGEGYLRRLSAEAVSLYVFLCVVANREGKSWYSDGRLVGMVRLSSLAGARRQLVEAGLVCWTAPVYTVLGVPVMGAVSAPAESVEPGTASGERTATLEEIGQMSGEIRRRMGWS